jgi:predicted nucleic acid-binding protein
VYILDTNVLSVTAPTKALPDRELQAWIRRNSDRLFLSAISLMELNHGATRLEHRRAAAKAARLTTWIELVHIHYERRILLVDAAVALRAGELITVARAGGVEIDTEDAIIAATADLHSLTVLTDNVRHFAPIGVAYIDPFVTLPPDAE